MNQKNVDALNKVLHDFWGGSSATFALAEYLAQRGVLVPAALTDEQVFEGLDDAVIWEYRNHEMADRARAALECLARGEPPEGERPR